MNLQDWWDCEAWQEISPNRWKPSLALDWKNTTQYDWRALMQPTWGGIAPPLLQPLFSAITLESLGISQDADYIYIPEQSINASKWGSMSLDSWKNISIDAWNFAPLTANQLFYLLMLKLQSANMSAHKVAGVNFRAGWFGSNYREYINFAIESRAEVM